MAKYPGIATATGGRNGRVETSDGLLKFDLSIPKGMGGSGREGTTNPGQLFACGHAACFGCALDAVARAKWLVASGAEVTCEAELDKAEGGCFLPATLTVKPPKLERETAQGLVEATHQVRPYRKATRGNINVTLLVA